MPKNVSITLDGKTKTISGATKIQTCLEDGGNCLWIPKDDVPLTTLSVTEDGTYYPPENYYGFSKVIADGIGTTQMGELIEKTVDKNGTYNIGDESGSPYGYSKFTVNVDLSEDSGGGGDSKTPVVGKDEDGNDEMVDTDDDGNIVMTALPTDIKVIIPPTKLEYNRYETIDYSGISVYAYISKAVHWLGTTTVQLEEGSVVNPISIDGETVTVSVGDGVLYTSDQAGQNDVQLVWDGVKWIKFENYSAEKAIWKSDDYPTGKIPFEELIFPIKRVNNDIVSSNSYELKGSYINGRYVAVNKLLKFEISTTLDMIQESVNAGHEPTKILDIPFRNSIIGEYVMEPSDGCSICVYSGLEMSTVSTVNREIMNDNGHRVSFKTYYVIIASSNSSCVLNYTRNEVYDLIRSVYYDEYRYDEKYAYGYYVSDVMTRLTTSDSYDVFRHSATINGKTVYYDLIPVYSIPEPPIKYVSFGNYGVGGAIYLYNYEDHTISQEKEDDVPDYELAWVSVYGEEIENNIPITIPVQWKRPGDGKILETTFTAWMKNEESNDGGQQPQPAPTPPPG